jgi:hypothetical protein
VVCWHERLELRVSCANLTSDFGDGGVERSVGDAARSEVPRSRSPFFVFDTTRVVEVERRTARAAATMRIPRACIAFTSTAVFIIILLYCFCLREYARVCV